MGKFSNRSLYCRIGVNSIIAESSGCPRTVKPICDCGFRKLRIDSPIRDALSSIYGIAPATIIAVFPHCRAAQRNKQRQQYAKQARHTVSS